MDERSERIQNKLEWPVVVAALLTIPILIAQESELGRPWEQISNVLNWTTWSVFVFEFVVMMWVVPRKRIWLRSHLIDTAVVVLTPPFAPAAWQAARVFRLVRLLRLTRVFRIKNLLSLEGIRYAALIAVATVFFGGAIFATVENSNGQHLTTWDGLWWAITTVTTVGYAEIPVKSDGGRIIAIAIMTVGIGFVALLTAFVADRFINEQHATESKEDQILAELQQITARLERLEH